METEPKRIRVLVADDAAETRASIQTLLSLEDDIEVVGEAADGQEALAKARELLPDIVLMDMRMPVLDGLAATEAITAELPSVQVIMISVMSTSESLRQAMMAGAREYLVKPFAPDELIASIRRVHELYGRPPERPVGGTNEQRTVEGPTATASPLVVAVAGPKGGVGRTTVATNLAVALAGRNGAKVALVDACLRFGDVGLSLNLRSDRSIADLTSIPIGEIDIDMVESAMMTHSSGLRVLLAPARPEHGEMVTPPLLRKVVQELRQAYQYIVVDLPPVLHDAELGVVEQADAVVLLFTLEMAALKNIKLFLEFAREIGYNENKLLLVANKAGEPGGLRMEDVEEALRFKTAVCLPDDGKLTRYAMNKGLPFASSHRGVPLSRAINDLADALLTAKADKAQDKKTGLLSGTR